MIKAQNTIALLIVYGIFETLSIWSMSTTTFFGVKQTRDDHEIGLAIGLVIFSCWMLKEGIQQFSKLNSEGGSSPRVVACIQIVLSVIFGVVSFGFFLRELSEIPQAFL